MADAKKVKRKTVKAASGDGAESPDTVRNRQLRELLQGRRDELLSESRTEISKYVTGENRDTVDSALDDGDLAVIDHNETVALQVLGAHRDALLKIDESLRKLDEGTYGICEDCGDQISTERLKVLPFAIRCRDCQELKEQEEAMEKLEEQQ